MRTLAIMEAAHRGGVEKQFFTPLYLAIELHHQLGGLDLLLRGPAVTCAVAHDRRHHLDLADADRCAVPDPRAELSRLIELGVRVAVERSALVGTVGGEPTLLPGVEVVDDGATALRWHTYRDVTFL